MAVLSVENWQEFGFGLYVHWPFCQAKCPYCDFNSHVSSQITHSDWLAAYVFELERYQKELGPRTLTSIYFGGGTPSLMDPSVTEAVIVAAQQVWNFSNDIEITLEANPSSVETVKFADFKTAGINRISLGVQALNDSDLRRLGRIHSVKDACSALDVISNQFERYNFDLIYARQNQTLDDWEQELSEALTFGSDHLSLYQLTVELNTVFHARFERGQLKGLPDEDRSVAMYELTQELCEGAGLPAYEVSNHAKAGQESKHNLIYWKGGDFVGIGPGAHGRIGVGAKRHSTVAVSQPKDWLSGVPAHYAETRETLSQQDVLAETLMMGLRINSGVSLSRLGVLGFHNQSVVDDLVLEGFLNNDHEKIWTTQKGRLLLNSLIGRLLS